MTDTIFALSSGQVPAAIGIIRISGPEAAGAVEALAGSLPEPRKAVLRALRDADGAMLDRALVLWFPGEATATGEPSAEFHCHGGRAVVAAVEAALEAIPGLRRAYPGEFTRRAFLNGRIDLAQAEGLADLISSETESQRLSAIAASGGQLSSRIDDWRNRVLTLGAQVEAVLDFSDEEDAEDLPAEFELELTELQSEIAEWLARPGAERLRDGVRVVLGGPPNSGKSSLFNALLDEGAAIVSDIAGTTRDVIERPVALYGVPFVLVDTAGVRDGSDDAIEAVGIERAWSEFERADIVLWLGEAGKGPAGSIDVASKADLVDGSRDSSELSVSAVSGEGLSDLIEIVVGKARSLLPKPGTAALNRRQRAVLSDASEGLDTAAAATDPLIVGEGLRRARVAFDAFLGKASTEDMLDNLFGRFCIGK